MVLMTLAYAQRTGDNGYLSKHYGLLDQWTQYLIDEALIPANQISRKSHLLYTHRFD